MTYIYLAAPYSTGITDTDRQSRARRMAERHATIGRAAGRLIDEGHIVYSPISHGCAVEPHITRPMTHADWLQQCKPLLLGARELRVLMLDGWRESAGVALEIQWASEAGIPVGYIGAE